MVSKKLSKSIEIRCHEAVHNTTMVAKIAAIKAPQAPRPRIDGALLPELPVVVAAATAWMPKVVPVRT